MQAAPFICRLRLMQNFRVFFFFSLLTKKFFEVVEQKSLDFLLVGVSLILFLIEYGIYSRHDCHC